MTRDPRSPHLQASELLDAARAEILSDLADRVSVSPLPSGDSDGQKFLRQVAGYLLADLRRALVWDKPALFTDCVGWAKAALIQRGVPASALALHLEHVTAVLRRGLPGDAGSQASEVVMAALRAMPDMPDELPAFLRPGAPISPLATLYFRALLRGDRQLASRLVLQVVELGTPVKEIYLHVFLPTLYEIGRLWQINQISVAEEHYTTAATQLIMSQLYSYIFSSKKIGRTVVVVCVSGELHELGARMVADFFEIDGWDSYYTGANTPISDVVQAIVERRASVLAISATIAHHVAEVKSLVNLVRTRPECSGVKIIVGGFPFNHDPQLWRQVGADGSGPDAEAAVVMANVLVGDNLGGR